MPDARTLIAEYLRGQNKADANGAIGGSDISRVLQAMQTNPDLVPGLREMAPIVSAGDPGTPEFRGAQPQSPAPGGNAAGGVRSPMRAPVAVPNPPPLNQPPPAQRPNAPNYTATLAQAINQGAPPPENINRVPLTPLPKQTAAPTKPTKPATTNNAIDPNADSANAVNLPDGIKRAIGMVEIPDNVQRRLRGLPIDPQTGNEQMLAARQTAPAGEEDTMPVPNPRPGVTMPATAKNRGARPTEPAQPDSGLTTEQKIALLISGGMGLGGLGVGGYMLNRSAGDALAQSRVPEPPPLPVAGGPRPPAPAQQQPVIQPLPPPGPKPPPPPPPAAQPQPVVAPIPPAPEPAIRVPRPAQTSQPRPNILSQSQAAAAEAAQKQNLLDIMARTRAAASGARSAVNPANARPTGPIGAALSTGGIGGPGGSPDLTLQNILTGKGVGRMALQ